MGVWYKQVKSLYLRAEELYKKNEWICRTAQALRSRAAIEAHTEELRLYQELDNREMVTTSNQEFAYIYASMDDFDRVNEIMPKSVKIFKEMGLGRRYANCITDLCANYLDQNKPDPVIKRLPDAIQYYKENEFAVGVSIAVYNLGEAYMLKKNTKKPWSSTKSPQLYGQILISRGS